MSPSIDRTPEGSVPERRSSRQVGGGLRRPWPPSPFLWLAFALLGAVPGRARAEIADEATRSLLGRIERSSAAVETLSAEFVQRTRVKLFKQELRSRGRLYFQRPRRIRWEYLEPDPSLLVLDGDRATLRAPGAPPQVFDLTRDATMRAIFDQIGLWLGAGALTEAERDYRVSSNGTPKAPALVLEPRPGSVTARAFVRITLRFAEEGPRKGGALPELVLRGIRLDEPSGDEKEIEFTRVERNRKLPADAFR
ncbi:MAG TPA: outer membrane lipoprotein carrier protein LolA [Polyangia bacterium]|nr:outer membrane lipoprotein carrier protein LolA [Polyangia bacterium]